MTTFKFYLSAQVDVPDAVLQKAGQRLTGYFNRVCQSMTPRKFTHASFKLDPHAGELGSKDLLCYITQSSMVLRMFPDAQRSGRGGGGTVETPHGLLSEVFWTGGLRGVGSADRQGIALANLVFHEFAHNKHLSDQRALQNGEKSGGVFVHSSCGMGIFAGGVSYGFTASADANSDNIKAMARVLDNENKQYSFGLFDDDLGF
jgi:hypothetical protein